MSRDVERAVARRASADARVRSVTGIALAASAALTAALTAVVGAPSHLRQTVVRGHRSVARQKPVDAPSAPLVQVRSEAPSAQPSPPAAPAPAPAASAPVAVSGGS